jgi:hypothetical protein
MGNACKFSKEEIIRSQFPKLVTKDLEREYVNRCTRSGIEGCMTHFLVWAFKLLVCSVVTANTDKSLNSGNSLIRHRQCLIYIYRSRMQGKDEVKAM